MELYQTGMGVTIADFMAFHDGAQGGNQVTLEVTLDVCSDLVADLAPRPEVDEAGNLPTDYVRRARNAEKMLARHLFDTKGFVSSQSSLVGSSISYQNDPAVLKIIRDSMGEYAADKDGVGELTTWPR